jgi:hypothetical protein
MSGFHSLLLCVALAWISPLVIPSGIKKNGYHACEIIDEKLQLAWAAPSRTNSDNGERPDQAAWLTMR